MKVAVLMVYALPFTLQIAGAAGVIQDVRSSVRNMRQFNDDLAEAEAAADKHRDQFERLGGTPMARLTQAREQVVDQTGPAATIERKALVKYVTAHNDMSDCRRWTAVGLLLLYLTASGSS